MTTYDYRKCFFTFFDYCIAITALKRSPENVGLKRKRAPEFSYERKATPYPRTSLKLTVLEQFRMRKKSPLNLPLLSR